MTLSRPRRWRALAVTTALVASVVTMVTATSGATAAPSSSPRAAATAAQAPEPAGSATGFQLFIRVPQQPIPCLTANFDSTADPYLNRNSCAYVNFTVAGASGALTSELFAEGASAPFATPAVTQVNAATGAHRVLLEPSETDGNDWSEAAGAVRLVIKDGAGPIGEYTFFYNALVATLSTGSATAEDAPFTVTGEIVEHTGGTAGGDTGVPAKYKIQVADADGTVVHTSEERTAADDGSFSYTIENTVTGALPSAGPEDNYRTTLRVSVVDASYTDPNPVVSPTGRWEATTAGSTGHTILSPATELELQNSFVSSVGWVKPGGKYPSRIIVTNPTTSPVTPTSIDVTAPTGSTILSAGATAVNADSYSWVPGEIPAGQSRTLVLESQADALSDTPTIVWRDLSSTAVMKVPSKPDVTQTSHGPKVIPPSEVYDTARYGDRPFPVVPVQYIDRQYQPTHSGDSLESVINDPDFPGSTFNLFQEMSLEQLFPNGTVPSAGKATEDFDYEHGFAFTKNEVPGNTCKGTTLGNSDVPLGGTPAYPERITNGVYNLPGQTEYYGSDSNGSAVVFAQAGQAQLADIDSGCGDTGKLVYDAAVLADPEIDYSDYDTDKDGVVDFFMVVFAGCGGNGASQLAFPGDPLLACPYDSPSYDNVWPHSSTLESGYSDPTTKLPGYTTDDQLKNLEGEPLWYTDTTYAAMTTEDKGPALKVFVRVGPYNVNPETAIDKASVISHEYGHSLGLPDFYSLDPDGRETYGDWNLMATDKSQHMDAYSRQEMGWVVPEVLDSTRTETDIPDSKTDIGEITWKDPEGEPYTLENGPDGIVHNSQMYVAKLPGRTLLEESAFETGDKATPKHLWWSGSGNDFGCAPLSGRNFDLAVPELADLAPTATVTLSLKHRWDIEWDYDYGFVMTTTNGGETYTSHPSENGYTTGTNTIPPAKSNNACQDTYSNGLTGTSGSYYDDTVTQDRQNDFYKPAVFIADSFDVSDLAGQQKGAIRFSYSTDPGLARPGWFIDDVKLTVDPDGDPETADSYDVFVTDFETSGDPGDPRVFNGGCQESLTVASKCTKGWKFLQGGAESEQDHAYYMEMRDRSSFDFDGRGQADRGAAAFQPGFYLAYTDESHGYGNVGTDHPPAQSPLDSVPEPGELVPNLDDAAFVDGADRSSFSDSSATPHVDNYPDPSSESGNWEFGYDCLTFKVDSMSGEETVQEASDLTGTVSFDIGSGCGPFNYGHSDEAPGGGDENTQPTAQAKATPTHAETGEEVKLSAADSTDKETPNDLDYSWDFGDGGSTKDAVGKNVKVKFSKAGRYTARVTVTDPQGLRDVATATVQVTGPTMPVAKFKMRPRKAFINSPVRLSAANSGGDGGLQYLWDYGDGGSKADAKGVVVRPRFKRAGYRTISLTVTDSRGRSDTTSQKILVRRAVKCRSSKVERTGSWREVSAVSAPNGQYCDNLGSQRGPDTLTYRFRGPQLDVYHGQAKQGGRAAVFIDGERRGVVKFRGTNEGLRFKSHKVFGNLGKGEHTMRLVVMDGQAYIASFITIR